MFFGEKRAKGIITGKSPTGYTVGEDAFDRPGKPMVRIWLDHLPEGGNPGEDKLTLERDKPGDAPWSPMEEGDFIPLSGGFFDSGHVLVRVCEHCRRAVIDYGSGQCDYNEQVRKSFLFP